MVVNFTERLLMHIDELMRTAFLKKAESIAREAPSPFSGCPHLLFNLH